MPEWSHEFPLSLPGLLARQMQQDREIRRLRIWLQEIAVANGLRATSIIGIIDPDNLPSGAQGGLLIYISFGSEPTGGQTLGNTVCYASDMIVQT